MKPKKRTDENLNIEILPGDSTTIHKSIKHMNYQKKVKQHLGTYKKEVLGVDEKGLFKHNGNEYCFDHILPKQLADLNIMKEYREPFLNSDYSKINYHRYFHHLNSSQALCINLFFPLIHEQKLNVILELLELPGKGVRRSEFEKLSPIEQTSGRKTNFDFYLELTDGKQIFFEVKYTEQEFGKAKHDQRHIEKFEKTYLPLLRNNPFICEEFKTVNMFLGNYQIMRNLVHIGESDYVVFLFPEANQNIQKQASMAFNKMLSEKGREKLKILYLEEMVQHILKSLEPGLIMDHFLDFGEKYFTLN